MSLRTALRHRWYQVVGECADEYVKEEETG